LQADAPSAPAYWRSRYGHISNTPTWDESGESEVIISFEKGAVAHPLKKKDRSKSQKRLYNFGLLL